MRRPGRPRAAATPTQSASVVGTGSIGVRAAIPAAVPAAAAAPVAVADPASTGASAAAVSSRRLDVPAGASPPGRRSRVMVNALRPVRRQAMQPRRTGRGTQTGARCGPDGGKAHPCGAGAGRNGDANA
ncbi:hypothetical protein GCM10009731_39500 [Streptomyces globosus]